LDSIRGEAAPFFPGFRSHSVDCLGTSIHAVVGGNGPPLLLLHGAPQSHVMWREIAPALAERFTVVASDLRGYGLSAKPPGGIDHSAYSKRTMAADQIELMCKLGFDRYCFAGHDRGAGLPKACQGPSREGAPVGDPSPNSPHLCKCVTPGRQQFVALVLSHPAAAIARVDDGTQR
jgi:pimeloyl-ACP methyl ester carboxylesterase